MTNEKLIEELLWEAHDLGIHNEVMELSKKFQEKNSRVDAIQIALLEIKSKLKNTNVE